MLSHMPDTKSLNLSGVGANLEGGSAAEDVYATAVITQKTPHVFNGQQVVVSFALS